jgi:hypothetical protein
VCLLCYESTKSLKVDALLLLHDGVMALFKRSVCDDLHLGSFSSATKADAHALQSESFKQEISISQALGETRHVDVVYIRLGLKLRDNMYSQGVLKHTHEQKLFKTYFEIKNRAITW